MEKLFVKQNEDTAKNGAALRGDGLCNG